MSFDNFEKLTPDDRKDLADFVELTRRKRKLDEEKKQIETKIKAIAKKDGRLLMRFRELGIPKITDVDGATVSIRRDIRPKLFSEDNLSTDQMLEKLSEVGYDDMIKHSFNASEFAKLLREALKDDPTLSIEDVIPEEAKGLISAGEEFMLICRG